MLLKIKENREDVSDTRIYTLLIEGKIMHQTGKKKHDENIMSKNETKHARLKKYTFISNCSQTYTLIGRAMTN
jgi:hypothetical protein